MEPLKEMFNEPFYKNFTDALSKSYKGFKSAGFFKDVILDLDKRELNERLRHTSLTLHRYLPKEFRHAVKIMKDAAPALKTGYTALVFPDYVGLYGKDDFTTSLEALKYFTVFGSSEFAIREFIRIDPGKTLAHMHKWTNDADHHVRRLASEGSRPRLPWSFKLEAIIRNPALTKNILENLKADDHLYVRKSVANHLNDISKDHPRYMIESIREWELSNPHTKWIIKHACRTLIKKGDPDALKLFQFSSEANIELSRLSVKPAKVKLGDTVTFSFQLQNRDDDQHHVVIDYAVAYVRLSGSPSRKVFKLKEVTLQPGEAIQISRNQVFKNFSTRTHYTGRHVVTILVNGKESGEKNFHLDAG